MTLVVGLNLSDRIYLAADSRATNIQNGNKEDNILKIMPVWGRNVLDQGRFDDNFISLAVAGDIGLATFLYKKITTSIKAGEISSDIRRLLDDLDKNFFKDLVDIWLAKNPYNKSCYLLFGGLCFLRNKKISLEKLEELVSEYNNANIEYKKERPQIEELLKIDPIFKKINEKMIKEAGKTVLQALDESSRPKIPDHILEATQKGSTQLNNLPDSLIFSVEIGIYKDGLYFKKTKAEWGQFLARGAQDIREGDLPQDLLATLELMSQREKNKPYLMEGAIITSTIKDIAEKNNIKI